MAIFKHILIPVDFSAHSSAALLLGSEMAARFGQHAILGSVAERTSRSSRPKP